MQEIRFVIEEEMFKWLVQGKEVVIQESDGTKLAFILSDIGFDRMEKAIQDAKLKTLGITDC